MRYVAIGCGVLLLLAIVLLVWIARRPIVAVRSGGGTREVTLRQLPAPDGEILVQASLSSDGQGYRLTEIEAARELVETLGLSAPEGFREEPLPLSARERRDPDAVAWAAEHDRENVRWVGSVPIRPDAPVVLRFAAEAPAAASGQLDVSYEWKWGLGGGSAMARVTLNEADS